MAMTEQAHHCSSGLTKTFDKASQVYFLNFIFSPIRIRSLDKQEHPDAFDSECKIILFESHTQIFDLVIHGRPKKTEKDRNVKCKV